MVGFHRTKCLKYLVPGLPCLDYFEKTQKQNYNYRILQVKTMGARDIRNSFKRRIKITKQNTPGIYAKYIIKALWALEHLIAMNAVLQATNLGM